MRYPRPCIQQLPIIMLSTVVVQKLGQGYYASLKTSPKWTSNWKEGKRVRFQNEKLIVGGSEVKIPNQLPLETSLSIF